jgi:hypothetical protein
MSKNLKTFLVLLGGLLFSSILRIRFNITEGFEFHHFWIVILPLKIIDIDYSSSSELMLTSAFIGYVFYIVFRFILLTDIRQYKVLFLLALLFFLIVSLALIFECIAIYSDYHANFSGQYMRIGPFLFIAGLLLFLRTKRPIIA